MSMRILIATPLYPPDIGGPATHTRMLEVGLQAKGISVEVLSFGAVRRWPPVLRHGVFAIKLWRAARRVELVFSQDPFSCGLPALLAARVVQVPFVVRIPGDYAWEQARERFGVTDSVEEFQKKRYGFLLEMFRSIEQFVVRRADVVVTPSAFIGRIVKGWRPRRLKVIYNGVDVPKDIVLPDPIPQRPFMVTASRLIYGKGFECLIDLLQEMPDWRLVIVGTGPLEKQLKDRVARTGTSDQVIFTGALSRERMFGWYKAATAFVLNTEFETFSFQIAESLASGTPTISTAVGGIPEVLKDGVQGVLVTPNDQRALREAIESVIQDPETWDKRKEEGLRRAQELSSERSVSAFAGLFKDICRR